MQKLTFNDGYEVNVDDRVFQLIARLQSAARHPIEQDLKRELQRLATKSSAKFIQANLLRVQSVSSWEQVHIAAAKMVSPPFGLILEFGVFSGKTINFISDLFPEHCIHGFDSFEGLPEAWRDGYDKGHFGIEGLPKVRDNVVLHKGWFDETLPDFVSTLAEGSFVSYLHVDCDLYSSTKTILEVLKPFFVCGTVIVFDEYFNYAGWETGEHLAFQEFIEDSVFDFDWITFNHKHEQVAVQLVVR